MQRNTTDLVAASADTSSSSRWNWKSKLQSVSQLNRNRRADTVVLFRYFPNDRSRAVVERGEERLSMKRFQWLAGLTAVCMLATACGGSSSSGSSTSSKTTTVTA